MKSKRRLPQRTCIICRKTMNKRDLIRVVRTPEGHVTIDPRGKVPGRGAYLCSCPECFRSRRARGAIIRALDVQLDEESWKELSNVLGDLAAERGSWQAEDTNETSSD